LSELLQVFANAARRLLHDPRSVVEIVLLATCLSWLLTLIQRGARRPR